MAMCQDLRMTSPDDPEERIRQLEQSAASYGATELGTDQVSQLPPPVYATPPPGYGAPPSYDPYQPPFGMQYAPVKKRAPVGLIIGLAVFVFVVLGGIAAVVWNVSSTIKGSGLGGGGGPGHHRTYAPPTISFPSFPGVPGVPGDSGVDTESTATSRAPVSVAGVDKTTTVVCQDGAVNVSGVNNTVTVTGHCISLNVSGVDNKVTIDSTDAISATGFQNDIVYLSGDPAIDATDANTVTRG
jgi:hypothetical protein